MEVVPAIDLRGGKCVRLYQGDYGRETVYSEDPVDVARHWVSCGASRLHLVDLDAALPFYIGAALAGLGSLGAISLCRSLDNAGK